MLIAGETTPGTSSANKCPNLSRNEVFVDIGVNVGACWREILRRASVAKNTCSLHCWENDFLLHYRGSLLQRSCSIKSFNKLWLQTLLPNRSLSLLFCSFSGRRSQPREKVPQFETCFWSRSEPPYESRPRPFGRSGRSLPSWRQG